MVDITHDNVSSSMLSCFYSYVAATINRTVISFRVLLYFYKHEYEFPQLAKLMILDYSAPLEKLFSIAEKIFCPDRGQLR